MNSNHKILNLTMGMIMTNIDYIYANAKRSASSSIYLSLAHDEEIVSSI